MFIILIVCGTSAGVSLGRLKSFRRSLNSSGSLRTSKTTNSGLFPEVFGAFTSTDIVSSNSNLKTTVKLLGGIGFPLSSNSIDSLSVASGSNPIFLKSTSAVSIPTILLVDLSPDEVGNTPAGALTSCPGSNKISPIGFSFLT